ncbi:maternal effect embryo arrest 18 protein [Moniliophthora roreri MCA 2997]|uniref:Maternal effect embryo arrest 18 protein n=1 Tax=Moniliophthora roreri (strain MCA 2997) TaxID=1381753 RepID=V2XWK2_MONRO|nr:maternal effect embryo arrest 18 protein [Moniliophthora roreri MCA 2997]
MNTGSFTLKVQQDPHGSPTSSVFDLPISNSTSDPAILKPNIRILPETSIVEPPVNIKSRSPGIDSSTASFVVVSGGTGGNAICTAFSNASFVLPVSDDGGSSSEIIRVLGGPSIGDIRSRLIRLIPHAPPSSPLDAIRTLLAYRLPVHYSECQAREEWRDIVEGKSHLWHGIPTDRKETIRGFLVYFESELLKRAHKNFTFLNGSIGNYFLAAAQGFFRSLPSAIFLFSSITNSGANILPVIVTNHTVTIAAELENGERLVGQCEISHPVVKQPSASATAIEECSPIDSVISQPQNVMFEHDSKYQFEHLSSRISRLLYINAYGMKIHPSPNPEYISSIGTSDVFVYSCGSLWTSIIPCLALRGVGPAIARSRSLRAKVLLLNSENDRETDGYTAVDYVQAITRTLNDCYQPQVYGIGTANTQYPISAFVTDLVYLKGTRVVVNVKRLTAMGVHCTEIEAGDNSEPPKFNVACVKRAIDEILAGQRY